MSRVIETMGKSQVVIECEQGLIFQSYESVIAIKSNDGPISLSEHYDYSRTTMKYLSRFLGHGVAETRKKIASGEYKLNIDTKGKEL